MTKSIGTSSKIPGWITARREFIERAGENREILVDWIAGQPRLEWVRPDAGIVAFPDFGAVDRPMSSFFEVESAFRIGFGVPKADLEDGLERLAAALS